MIDVFSDGHYNERMDADDVQTLLAMETAEPKRRLIRSSGALYTVLILLVFGAIAAANALNTRFDVPRAAVEIPLNVLILLYGWHARRTDLTSCRYTLTNRVFAVERIVGGRERLSAAVDISDIIEVTTAEQAAKTGIPAANWSLRPAREASALRIRGEKGDRIWLVSASADFLEKLAKQRTFLDAEKREEPAKESKDVIRSIS